MANSFLRKYELKIGSPSFTKIVTPTFGVYKPDVQVKKVFISPNNSYVDQLTIPAGNETLTITDLQIEATIEYGIDKDSQKAEIKVYNLSDDSVSKIKANGIVSLKAGYYTDENLPLIVVGQILSVKTERASQDRVTTIVCADGYAARKGTHVSKSAIAGESYLDVLKYLVGEAAKVGVPLGKGIPVESGSNRLLANEIASGNATSADIEVNRIIKQVKSGVALEGELFEQINKAATEVGYRSYISLGKLYIEPMNHRATTTVVTIEPTTTISLEGVSDTTTSSSGSTESEDGGTTQTDDFDGVRATIFLDGTITTDSILRVKSSKSDRSTLKYFVGDYRIKSITHALNYYGDDWSTTIEANKQSG